MVKITTLTHTPKVSISKCSCGRNFTFTTKDRLDREDWRKRYKTEMETKKNASENLFSCQKYIQLLGIFEQNKGLWCSSTKACVLYNDLHSSLIVFNC